MIIRNRPALTRQALIRKCRGDSKRSGWDRCVRFKPIIALCLHLCLAAPRHAAIGRSGACGVGIAISQRMSTLAELAPGLTNSRYLLILHLHQCACSPTAPLRHRLLVRSEVEGNEEQEVGAEDADSSNRGKLFTGAFTRVREPLPVRGSEVGPRSEVNEAFTVLDQSRNQ